MLKRSLNFWRLKYSGQFLLKEKRGVSLIGIMISLIIVSILAMSLVHYLLPYRQTIALDKEAEEISNYLELARVKSIGMTDNKAWGVHLENPGSGDDYFEFYSTISDYTEKDIKVVVYLSWEINFSSPASGGNLTIQFAKDSGTTTASDIVIVSENGSSRTINVNSEGVVSISKN